MIAPPILGRSPVGLFALADTPPPTGEGVVDEQSGSLRHAIRVLLVASTRYRDHHNNQAVAPVSRIRLHGGNPNTK